MPQIQVPLIKGQRVSTKTDYRDALMVNAYAVIEPVLGADGYVLLYPGLTKVADSVGTDRAGNYNERFGEQYRVSGGSLVRVNRDNTVDTLGAIAGEDQATLDGFYSFNTQGVIAGGGFYLYSPSDGFQQVTDQDLGSPIDGVWVDNYYFMTDGEFLFHTDITDETSIDPLKFATAEFMPDPSLGLGKTQDNKVIVWGRYTVELFRNVASENFAFTRVPDRGQKIGIVATHAKTEAGGRYYFCGGRKGDSLGIHILGVGASEKVSTREIDKILAKYSEPELSDMRMESRSEGDVTFILAHLPNETICFNEEVAKKYGVGSAWTILKSDVLGDRPYRAINGVFDANRGYWVYGDKLTGNIGKLDNEVCTHYEEIVEGIIDSPLLKLETMSIDEIEMETIAGHTSDPGARVAISVTHNGFTYSQEWFDTYGEPLDYGNRFIIRQLGYVPDMVGIRFRVATRSRMSFAAMKVTYG